MLHRIFVKKKFDPFLKKIKFEPSNCFLGGLDTNCTKHQGLTSKLLSYIKGFDLSILIFQVFCQLCGSISIL
jgi:hypothetical protein